jgi:DNA mismatch repair protein MutL
MSDPRVQVLSDHVCNKIAAGEVIERPASVFKELVENSLDAGADLIEIEVLQGGRKAVIVTDNGHGMSRENALLSLERHATSKIRDVDDIEHIHTMGFRGEALAAIAAVSRFLVRTRRAEDLSGTEILVEGGELRDVRDAGCPTGTCIEVRNLFFNVPARRKFLRTESTELGNIRTMFRVFALAHPGVTLRLVVDGRELEHWPAQTSLADRIADLHGDHFLSQLRKIDLRHQDLHIHGYAGIPSLTRSDRRDQVVLVNRRASTAPVVGYAIKESYRDTLPRDRNPVVFLHLDMPPDWVDVNVHPTKREVRFRNATRVRDAILHALEEALRPASTETPAPAEPVAPRTPQLHPEARQPDLPPPGYPPPHSPPVTPHSTLDTRHSSLETPHSPSSNSALPTRHSTLDTRHSSLSASPWHHAEILGITGNRFVLLETEEGLVIMDPVAARERILYERAMEELRKGVPASQPLLMPETVTCAPDEAESLRERLEEAKALGFGIEPFGGDSFIVEALPAWMGDVAAEPVLQTLARDLDSGASRLDTSKALREALARSCCRLAAQSKGPIPAPELRRLVDGLQHCQMPYTTPFGRPTLIHMGFRELRRKFGLE